MSFNGTEKWRHTYLCGTAGIAAFMLAIMFSNPVLAQDEATDDTADDELVEEVIVTGSRIKRTEFSSPSPVQVLNMEMATLSGLVDVSDILQESTVAANAPQWNNMFTGYVVTGGSGTNAIDLRGLGDGKTLVLLNGRRLNPAGTRGTVSAVDLNTIPSAIVQRIEILKDGASSVYGSDAVAGVVNIITKKGVDGISGSFSRNVPFDGGGEITTVDMTIGFNSDDSSFMFGVDYLEREPLLYGDRDWAQCKVEQYRDPDTGEDLSLVDPTTGELKCWDSPAHDYNISQVGFGRQIYDPVNGNGSSDPANWRVGSLAERKFDHPRQDEAHMISPVKRISLFSFGNWGIDIFGDGTEGYYEFMYNSRRSNQNSGPRQLGLRVFNSPFSPFWTGGSPGSGIAFDVPLLLPYMQTSEQEVTWMRSIVGLTGEFSNGWSWDVNAGLGRSHGTYSSPQMLIDRIVNTLDVIEVAPGVYDCASNYDFNNSLNFDRGLCVPFNPFDIIANGQNSPGLFPQDLLDYITSVEVGETTYSQKSFSGYVTGELFDLPAGSIGAVLGVEFRRETIKDTPSSGSINGNLWGFTSSGITAGTDTVKELFAEIELPLLRDAAAAKSLTFSAAARYSDYDTAGSDITYKVGLNWQIIDALRLRSSFGTSFRAPSLYESFLGGQTAFTSASDPCADFGTEHSPGEPIYDNCLAETGDVNFVGYSSTPRVITFGNAGRLTPETSESLSIGLIVEIEAIDLSFAVDYFEFTIKDEIDRFGARSILNQCYNLPTSEFRQPGTLCDFITPRSSLDGSIEEINDSYFNINQKYQEGVDFTVRYKFAAGPADIIADLRATKILNFTQDLFGGNVDDFKGTLGYADLNGQFDLQVLLGAWTFYYGLDYIAGQQDYDWFGLDPETSIYDLVTNDVIYHDLAVRYRGDGWAAQVGIQNLADRKPPTVSDLSAPWAGNAAFNTGYDQRGRTYFFNLTKGF
ncbi:MAG: TonB-dependent receptor [Xanthomonadales bacterium]